LEFDNVDRHECNNLLSINQTITNRTKETRYEEIIADTGYLDQVLVEEFYDKRFDNIGIDRATIVGYGHLGDYNLHLNVSAPKYDDILAIIKSFVYEWTFWELNTD
ncbi:D-2-hydroxyglutarate dehydrogenase, mitochondrial-like protein isoform X1, partial [Tanacetum coccineum]